MNYKKEVEDKIEKKGKLSDGDYYLIESGLLVFTEQYHKKRGYCCGSNCRHCPFIPMYQKGNRCLK